MRNDHSESGTIISWKQRHIFLFRIYLLTHQSDWRKIWLWHIAVILSLFFRTLRSGLTSGVIPATSFLSNDFPSVKHFALSLIFIFNGTLNRAEGVEVFDLSTFAKSFTPLLGERNIDVKAHITIIKISKTDSRKSHQAPEFLTVIMRIMSRMDIWHGDDLNERSIGTIKVNQ